MYRIAKQRDRASRDVQQVWTIKDNNGEVLTNKEIVSRWREYFVTLMNEKKPQGVQGVQQEKGNAKRMEEEHTCASV